MDEVNEMKKKVFAVFLAATMAVTSLTACGGGNKDGKKGSSDETYTVTMAYVGDKKEDTERIEKKINEIMKKDINMEIDLEPISWGLMEKP